MKNTELISLILIISVIAMSALIMLGLFFVTIPKENQQMVNIFAGAIITGALLTVFNWRFGSSKGSADKTTAMTKTAEALAQTTPEAIEAKKVE
jgi:uncharacterized BrkB/YihY/UPF0761 family membrane protein